MLRGWFGLQLAGEGKGGEGTATPQPGSGSQQLAMRGPHVHGERERILDFYTATSKQKVLRRGATRP